jgi:hypothetical protein
MFRKPNEITNNKNKMILLLDSRFYLDMSSVPNVHLLSVWFVVSCVGSLVVCSWAKPFYRWKYRVLLINLKNLQLECILNYIFFSDIDQEVRTTKYARSILFADESSSIIFFHMKSTEYLRHNGLVVSISRFFPHSRLFTGL